MRLLTDPLLRSRVLVLRRRLPLAGVEAAEAPDAVLISHLDRDHLDVSTLRRLPPGTPIIVPRGSAGYLRRRGFDRLVELSEGESTSVGDARVRAVPARHRAAARRGTGPVPALGYVIEAGARIYFAGDTALFDEMDQIGERLDLALLPVWGWGPRLGGGHLDPADAAKRTPDFLVDELPVRLKQGP